MPNTGIEELLKPMWVKDKNLYLGQSLIMDVDDCAAPLAESSSWPTVMTSWFQMCSFSREFANEDIEFNPQTKDFFWIGETFTAARRWIWRKPIKFTLTTCGDSIPTLSCESQPLRWDGWRGESDVNYFGYAEDFELLILYRNSEGQYALFEYSKKLGEWLVSLSHLGSKSAYAKFFAAKYCSAVLKILNS